jgi:hypothetical protein
MAWRSSCALLLLTPHTAAALTSSAACVRVHTTARSAARHGALRSHSPVALEPAESSGLALYDLLFASPPVKFERTSYFKDEGMVDMITGVTVTPAGWAALAVVALWSLFSPLGIVQYSRRLREAEQRADEAGLPADQREIPPHERGCE